MLQISPPPKKAFLRLEKTKAFVPGTVGIQNWGHFKCLIRWFNVIVKKKLISQTNYYQSYQQEMRRTMPLTSSPAGVESCLCPLPFPSPHALAYRTQTLAERFSPLIISSFLGMVLIWVATVVKYLNFHWSRTNKLRECDKWEIHILHKTRTNYLN